MAAKLKIEKRENEIVKSSFGHLKKCLFLVTAAILNGERGCWTQF
jgi:hypothetical protein